MAKTFFTLFLYVFIKNYNYATFVRDFNIKAQKLKVLNLSACKILVLQASFN